MLRFTQSFQAREARRSFNLDRGKFVLLCFLPVFSLFRGKKMRFVSFSVGVEPSNALSRYPSGDLSGFSPRYGVRRGKDQQLKNVVKLCNRQIYFGFLLIDFDAERGLFNYGGSRGSSVV